MNRKQYKKRIKKIKSGKTGEMISIYNALEERYMNYLESDDSVIRYQKNIPLTKWEERVCFKDIDIQKYCPSDYTSDFLVEFSSSRKTVVEVVARENLCKPRIAILLEISRRYWISKDVEWGIITDSEDVVDEIS